MQSTQTLKEADPHDVFAIETMLAARAERTHPVAHDAPPAAPPVHAAPQSTLDFSPGSQGSSAGAPAPQLEPKFDATEIRDVRIEGTRPDEISLDDFKPLNDRPTSKWAKRIVMALLGLGGAVAAAGWQHYGDHAKAMAADWTPPFVLAALSPSQAPPAAEQPAAPAIPAAVADQSAVADQPPAPAAAAPVRPQQAVAPAVPAPSAESAQLQAMTQDLAAMSQQVEELKAGIAQLKASQAQMARELAKASEAKAVGPSDPNPRPTIAAAPPPRPAAAPVRKPKPAYPPAQAAYVPPIPPVAAAPALPPPAPRPAIADDGEPVVRPPMPLR